ncbi:hypothetical protein PR202_gb24895 [Eleusine coracana subsp. coracana]|uniref:Uncharacterized protein n=1 Tax=Eleusine coracana subsp. coracana TaxID=191504 RepID=A0AAV5FMR6_ELECO|nr:hypothetical protein PR202_gb24895 [Eleusine coracana subsp. coracana]
MGPLESSPEEATEGRRGSAGVRPTAQMQRQRRCAGSERHRGRRLRVVMRLLESSPKDTVEDSVELRAIPSDLAAGRWVRSG